MLGKIGKYFIMIFIIMLGIYGIKILASKVKIPVVSKVAEAI